MTLTTGTTMIFLGLGSVILLLLALVVFIRLDQIKWNDGSHTECDNSKWIYTRTSGDCDIFYCDKCRKEATLMKILKFR